LTRPSCHIFHWGRRHLVYKQVASKTFQVGYTDHGFERFFCTPGFAEGLRRFVKNVGK